MVFDRMVPASSALLCVTLSLLLLFAKPVLNLTSNEAEKPVTKHCSRHTKEGERNSHLWTFENYPSVYLFGSIHRPYTSVWRKIPRNVKRAFKSSRKIYFEIGFSPKNVIAMMKCKSLPNRQTLRDVLPSRVFRKLQNYLNYIQSQIPEWLNDNEIKARPINPDDVFERMTRNWQEKRPIWILLQLASFTKEYVQSFVKGIPSLDLFMYLKGEKAGKRIGHLESAEEHCGLNNLNSSEVIVYLDELLTKYDIEKKEKHNKPEDTNDLLYHYICGNLSEYVFSSKESINTSSVQRSRWQTLQDFEQSLKKEMFLRRNKQMARKIIKEIKFERKRKKRRLFFTIGAAHLVGKRSIIDLLASKGFKPRHILAKDTLPRSRRYKMNPEKSQKHFENSRSNSRKESEVSTSFHHHPTNTSTRQQTEVTEENDEKFYPSSSAVKRSSLLNGRLHTFIITIFLSPIFHINS
ncbi:metalloprotease TIKI2-like [Dendronephthya gigantea]|uniref:metalloprotease TIKI2-like n=1 Tax=Dendronephthya gigantea TaxID=151771 RepID=UPI00106BF4D8|nr:metalloprotease TIKI2-like [Dendronephthya gigantea]